MAESVHCVGLVETVNHLICHLYPRIGGPWRATVEALKKRLDMFDGRRIFGVVRGAGLEDWELVRQELEGVATELIVNDNDAGLREVVTLRPAIEIVERLPGSVFFCHSKGATHHAESICQEWREAMFEVCLNYPALISAALEDKPICGPFRRFGGLGVEWHFSGSFFWFRAESVFMRHWRYVQDVWYGVETFPACNFHAHESRCLFMDRCGDLYDEKYWSTVVRPSLKFWRERMDKCTR